MSKQSVVFISYSRRNVAKANQITEILERGGHRPWIDNQLVPGTRWKQKIEQAINDSNAFLILLSPDALNSEYCQWEYALAVEQGKPVFPVVIEPVPETLPEAFADLSDIQFVDMTEGINATNTASLIGGVFQARPVTQTRIPIPPIAPENPPVDLKKFQEDSINAMPVDGTEPLTRLPLPNQNVLPRGIKAHLEVVHSPSVQIGSYPIHITNFTIGRIKTMDLSIPEKRISKHHLTLYWANSKFFIVDYSLNGTWLNGERIQNNRPVRLDADFTHRIDLARNNTVMNFHYSVEEQD